jgi:hypothetical protein
VPGSRKEDVSGNRAADDGRAHGIPISHSVPSLEEVGARSPGNSQ